MWKLLRSLVPSMQTAPQISADQVMELLNNKRDIVLIDVRTPIELTRGKIPGAINMPLDSFEAEIQNVVPDKQQKVYLYCLSGTRSDKAASKMLELGYKDVYSMTSGLLMWRYKQYPIQY